MAGAAPAGLQQNPVWRDELIRILRSSEIVRRAEEAVQLIAFCGLNVDSESVRALFMEDWLHRRGNSVLFAITEPPKLAGILNAEAARTRLEEDPHLRDIAHVEYPQFESEFAAEVRAAECAVKRGEAELAALAEEHLEIRLQISPEGTITGYTFTLFGLAPDLPDRERQEQHIRDRDERERRRAQVLFGVYRARLRERGADARI